MAVKLSIGAAWVEAAAFLRRERRVLAPVVLGLIMVPAVVTEMVQPRVARGEVPEGGAWVIVAILMLIAMIVGQLVIVLLANGWRGSVGEAIMRAARRVPTLMLAALAFIVPLFVLLSVALAVGGLTSGGMGRTAMSRLGPALAIALLLFIVAGTFVMIRLLPLVAVIATGSDGPIAALKRTFAMTRGQFWKLFGFTLLLTIAFLVVAVAISAVFGSLVTVALGKPEPWSVSQLLIALLGGLIQAAFVTIYTAMLARIAAQLSASGGAVPSSGT